MTYYTGFIAAVPPANREQFVEHVRAVWPLFKSWGAILLVETWGTDLPKGQRTEFYMAVQAQASEAVVFSWITWPDRETAETASHKMQTDPATQALPPMPFDGQRMVFGGFEPIFDSESHGENQYD